VHPSTPWLRLLGVDRRAQAERGKGEERLGEGRLPWESSTSRSRVEGQRVEERRGGRSEEEGEGPLPGRAARAVARPGAEC